MSKFLIERYASLDAYTPGEQPSDTQYIKLNTNESPYPPAPAVAAALCSGDIEKLRLYPNPDGARLIGALAEYHGIPPENIIIGNGSDELLAFAFLAFFGTHGVCFPDITYGFYPVYAELYGVPYETIPLREDFSADTGDYLACGKNIVLANPNAPTGIALALSDIEEIVKSNPDRLVLIDEAYVDFGGESALPLTVKYGNLLVLRTYSKSRSMAGARLAYAVAQKPVIDDLAKIKYSFNPYNVNSLTQTLGEISLREDVYFKEKTAQIINSRRFAGDRLREMGFTLTDSSANFIFARHPKLSGRELYLRLRERGILVRRWDKPRISDYLRITVGTIEQMETLLCAVSSILGEV